MSEPIYIECHPKKAQLPKQVFHTLEELAAFINSCPNVYDRKLFNADLSKLDLTCPKGRELLMQINAYTEHVIWPAEIAEQMAQRLESGKNSGLGIRGIHQKGYTGKGVNVAIVDHVLYVDHPEYKDNVVFYETGFMPSNTPKDEAWYHGAAVSSLLCGKNCGSAPDAHLFFWAHFCYNHEKGVHDARLQNPTLQKIIDWNNTHEEKDKIRCLSCSWGNLTDIAFEERQELFKKVEESGCMVFGGCYGIRRGRRSVGGAKRDLYSDAADNLQGPDNLADWPPELAGTCLIVPRDQRTFASYMGGYMYDELGGASWTYPYLSGLVACGLQAFPSYTQQKDWQDKIWQDLLSTGTKDPRNYGAVTVNPVKFIEKMEYYRALENKRLAEHFGKHK
ncbi:MAG: hypothetical protein ILP11_00715 [Alphaproteobacteria bacterium]|nr:hypothetical protein [Alphaproteobacteria bacterium]